MIPLLGAVAISRMRFASPTIVNHRAVAAAPVTDTIQASVQPASKTARSWLPEGQRLLAAIELISYGELRVGSEVLRYAADQITHDGRTYVVVLSERLPPHVGQPEHWEAMAVEVQSQAVT